MPKIILSVRSLTVLLLILALGACQIVLEDGTTIDTGKPIQLAMADSHSDCTASTLSGSYVFEARGVILDDSSGEPMTLPYAEAGILTLDGAGGGKGVASISVNGETWFSREAFEVTYEHVDGCVYTLTDGFELVFDMYAISSGNVVTYYSPGFSGKMVRQ